MGLRRPDRGARDIDEQVRLLRRQGLKVEVIAEIVSDLNRRLFARLFDLLAPPAIRTGGCLVVMGSEGRGEQTMRTDQDNALILAKPIDPAVLDRFRQDFSAALEGFGFAPCPGNVMVRNPAVVADACRLPGRVSPLGRTAGTEHPHGRRHPLRCGGRRR